MTSTSAATVSVVIPTKNEARNVGWVLERLPEQVTEVVLVDANSVDGTVEAALAVRPDCVVVRQTRKGKGNALAAGFEAATGDYIVMIDADGSMDPAEIADFTAALDAGADYAKGSRFAPGGGSDDITRLRRAGNWGLNALTNALFRSRYSDLCYGYNAFRRDCVAAFALPTAHGTTAAQWGDGFEIETMINVRVAVAGKKITEVASFEAERRYGVSNLNTFRDGFRVLGTIFDERRRATRSGRTSGSAASSALPAAIPAQRAELDLTAADLSGELTHA
ncbi:glycosyltransferase family 2 protein [Streptomyces sp. NP160]|uniref:glycosyltransferase family 2 protein n=1 Tax=Streptomyces sp. NP160 TaxID=2586637 RepID=UPI00111AA8D8|nr:glycosyltransferase family 2 protein [Streptomyces sp. NP160]TNM67476.1 glycosyltransferase family 2 protein [Streptomyces sp. NP160]